MKQVRPIGGIVLSSATALDAGEGGQPAGEVGSIAVVTRHGNGAGRGGARMGMPPDSPTPIPQHIPIFVPDTRRVKICYPIPVPIGYRVSLLMQSYPTRALDRRL